MEQFLIDNGWTKHPDGWEHPEPEAIGLTSDDLFTTEEAYEREYFFFENLREY